MKNLFYSRVRNFFYQNDIIYWLTPDGLWSQWACQLAHQHTGWTLPPGLLPSFIMYISKGLALSLRKSLTPAALWELEHTPLDTYLVQGLGIEMPGRNGLC